MSDKHSTETIEIDLSDFSKEQLIAIIQQSCSQDVSVNKIIEQFIEQLINAHEG